MPLKLTRPGYKVRVDDEADNVCQALLNLTHRRHHRRRRVPSPPPPSPPLAGGPPPS